MYALFSETKVSWPPVPDDGTNSNVSLSASHRVLKEMFVLFIPCFLHIRNKSNYLKPMSLNNQTAPNLKENTMSTISTRLNELAKLLTFIASIEEETVESALTTMPHSRLLHDIEREVNTIKHKVLWDLLCRGKNMSYEQLAQVSNASAEQIKTWHHQYSAAIIPEKIFDTSGIPQEVLDTLVKDVGLRIPVANALNGENIVTLGDLVTARLSDLGRIYNFGKQSRNEVLDMLKERGLKLRD